MSDQQEFDSSSYRCCSVSEINSCSESLRKTSSNTQGQALPPPHGEAGHRRQRQRRDNSNGTLRSARATKMLMLVTMIVVHNAFQPLLLIRRGFKRKLNNRRGPSIETTRPFQKMKLWQGIEDEPCDRSTENSDKEVSRIARVGRIRANLDIIELALDTMENSVLLQAKVLVDDDGETPHLTTTALTESSGVTTDLGRCRTALKPQPPDTPPTDLQQQQQNYSEAKFWDEIAKFWDSLSWMLLQLEQFLRESSGELSASSTGERDDSCGDPELLLDYVQTHRQAQNVVLRIDRLRRDLEKIERAVGDAEDYNRQRQENEKFPDLGNLVGVLQSTTTDREQTNLATTFSDALTNEERNNNIPAAPSWFIQYIAVTKNQVTTNEIDTAPLFSYWNQTFDNFTTWMVEEEKKLMDVSLGKYHFLTRKKTARAAAPSLKVEMDSSSDSNYLETHLPDRTTTNSDSSPDFFVPQLLAIQNADSSSGTNSVSILDTNLASLSSSSLTSHASSVPTIKEALERSLATNIGDDSDRSRDVGNDLFGAMAATPESSPYSVTMTVTQRNGRKSEADLFGTDSLPPLAVGTAQTLADATGSSSDSSVLQSPTIQNAASSSYSNSIPKMDTNLGSLSSSSLSSRGSSVPSIKEALARSLAANSDRSSDVVNDIFDAIAVTLEDPSSSLMTTGTMRNPPKSDDYEPDSDSGVLTTTGAKAVWITPSGVGIKFDPEPRSNTAEEDSSWVRIPQTAGGSNPGENAHNPELGVLFAEDNGRSDEKADGKKDFAEGVEEGLATAGLGTSVKDETPWWQMPPDSVVDENMDSLPGTLYNFKNEGDIEEGSVSAVFNDGIADDDSNSTPPTEQSFGETVASIDNLGSQSVPSEEIPWWSSEQPGNLADDLFFGPTLAQEGKTETRVSTSAGLANHEIPTIAETLRTPSRSGFDEDEVAEIHTHLYSSSTWSSVRGDPNVVSISVRDQGTGVSTFYEIRKNSPLKKLVELHAKRKGLSPSSLLFRLDGIRFRDIDPSSDNALILKIQDGDEITCIRVDEPIRIRVAQMAPSFRGRQVLPRGREAAFEIKQNDRLSTLFDSYANWAGAPRDRLQFLLPSASGDIPTVVDESQTPLLLGLRDGSTLQCIINDEPIAITILDSTGEDTVFEIFKSTPMEKLFDMYFRRKGSTISSMQNMRFTLSGKDGRSIHIRPTDTALSLRLENGSYILCSDEALYMQPGSQVVTDVKAESDLSLENDSNLMFVGVADPSGKETFFRIRQSTKMSKLFDLFAESQGMLVQNLSFETMSGKEIEPWSSPLLLKLNQGDVLKCRYLSSPPQQVSLPNQQPPFSSMSGSTLNQPGSTNKTSPPFSAPHNGMNFAEDQSDSARIRGPVEAYSNDIGFDPGQDSSQARPSLGRKFYDPSPLSAAIRPDTSNAQTSDVAKWDQYDESSLLERGLMAKAKMTGTQKKKNEVEEHSNVEAEKIALERVGVPDLLTQGDQYSNRKGPVSNSFPLSDPKASDSIGSSINLEESPSVIELLARARISSQRETGIIDGTYPARKVSKAAGNAVAFPSVDGPSSDVPRDKTGQNFVSSLSADELNKLVERAQSNLEAVTKARLREIKKGLSFANGNLNPESSGGNAKISFKTTLKSDGLQLGADGPDNGSSSPLSDEERGKIIQALRDVLFRAPPLKSSNTDAVAKAISDNASVSAEEQLLNKRADATIESDGISQMRSSTFARKPAQNLDSLLSRPENREPKRSVETPLTNEDRGNSRLSSYGREIARDRLLKRVGQLNKEADELRANVMSLNSPRQKPATLDKKTNLSRSNSVKIPAGDSGRSGASDSLLKKNPREASMPATRAVELSQANETYVQAQLTEQTFAEYVQSEESFRRKEGLFSVGARLRLDNVKDVISRLGSAAANLSRGQRDEPCVESLFQNNTKPLLETGIRRTAKASPLPAALNLTAPGVPGATATSSVLSHSESRNPKSSEDSYARFKARVWAAAKAAADEDLSSWDSVEQRLGGPKSRNSEQDPS